MKNKISVLKKLAIQIRRDILRMVHGAKSGHVGGSLGCTEYFIAMYWEIMDHCRDFNMDGTNEDLFFLSNGHISPVWYSTLARCGYFDIKELADFRKINSRLQGHPATKEGLPGVRIASGSLGQGLSVAIGACLAKKLNNDKKNVYVLMGDGELQEGQIWEAAMFASHHKIDNIIATVDINGQQIDGPVEKVISLKNLEDKWKAFGWKVVSCNGNNLEEVIGTIKKSQSLTGKKYPIINLMKTIMGFGVDFMMDDHKWHGTPPNDEQLLKALDMLPETICDY